MLAAVLAVFLQALVVQTHVDGLAGLGSTQTQLGLLHDRATVKVADTKADAACPICQAAATSGRTLLAAVASLALRPPVQYTAPRARAMALVVRASHAWQSRAPPLAS